MIGLGGDRDEPFIEAAPVPDGAASTTTFPVESSEAAGLPDPVASEARRSQIWFDGADDAYLVAAALRRYLDVSLVSDVILVPTNHGPGLDVPVDALALPLVRGLIQRFNGHVDRTPRDVALTRPAVVIEDDI
jgi:hypothetical protein